MPGGDGTGPLGAGTMSGRGFGYCRETTAERPGAGLGKKLFCRRGFGRGQCFMSPQKEQLEYQKTQLKARLESIEKQLDNL